MFRVTRRTRLHLVITVPGILIAGLLWMAAGFQGAVESAEPAGAEAAATPAPPPPAPGGPYLELIGQVPLEGELYEDRVILFFNEPVTAPVGPDGQPVPPLLFEERTVKSKWDIANNRIVIRASNMPPITTGRLNPVLTSTVGHSLNPSTPAIVLAKTKFEANKITKIETKPDSILLGLHFSLPIDPVEVGSRLTIKDNAGEAVPFTASAGTHPTICRLALTPPIDFPIRLHVPAGTPDATFLLNTKEDWNISHTQETRLTVKSVAWDQDEHDDFLLRLDFNLPVPDSDLSAHLSINNADTGAPVPFTVDGGNPTASHQVRLTPLPEPQTKLVVAMAPELASNEGLPLVEPATFQLQVPQPPPPPTPETAPDPLGLDYAYWREMGHKGVGLYVRFTETVSAEDLRKALSFEPAVDGLEVQAESWSGYLILGNFKTNENYIIRVAPGLTSSDGTRVNKSPLEQRLDSVPYASGIGFPYEGKYYFPRRNGTQFMVESRNRAEANITVNRLFPSNIAVALEAMTSEDGSTLSERYMEEIARKTVKLSDQRDQTIETPLDLAELFGADRRGVFQLTADDTYNSKLIVLTDLGVLAHWEDDEVVLFVHDLTSLQPVPLAHVSVYSYKNQLMAEANTGQDGIALIKALNTALGRPYVVVVESQNDYTFLELESREDDPVAYDESMPLFDKDGYDAYIYADRDLYRPGETARLRWIVRTNYGDALENVPLKLTVKRPNGSVYRTEQITLSALGSGALDFATEKSDPTGKYTVDISTPGDPDPLGLYYFSVEEFVPNRMAAETSVDQPVWTNKQPAAIHLTARHLFGAPAAEQNCEAAVALFKGAWKTQNWTDYRFTNSDEYSGELIPIGSATSNAEGKAEFSYTPDLAGKVTFPVRALVRGTVLESGGRAVSSSQEVTILPAPIMLGLRYAKAADGQNIEVFVAAVQPDETPAALDTVHVVLEREEWSHYVREYHGYNDWRWTRTFQEIDARDVPLTGGKGSVIIPKPNWGNFRLRVTSEATPQFSDLQFSTYWGDVEMLDQLRPSLLKLTLNKNEYSVGEEVEVRLEAPFDGTGIVIVQGEGILQAVPVVIKDRLGVMRFAVSDAEVPNVWIEATVIHGSSEGSAHVYPYSSFAMANVPVRNPRRQIAVAFPDLPTEVRPAQEWPVVIETRDMTGAPVAAEVTLAAVDEGIHGLTDYQTPDPYTWLLRPRRPEYNRAHYYDLVAFDFNKSPIGGDALARRFGKDAPFIGDNWIKPVALWSGAVNTDANGRAEIKLSLPEFSGQLRLVAVACTGASLGANGADIYVRRPYMLRTSMPRFALPGDAFQARASVFNTTQAPCIARISWTAGGTLQGSGSREMPVEPGKEASLVADISAVTAMGQGQIDWKAEVVDTAGAVLETLTESAPIPVRAPAAYETDYLLATLAPGESREFRNMRFLEADNTTLDLTVSSSALLRLGEPLRYLIHYPYGCVEQTTSACMGMFLLRKDTALVEAMLGKEWPTVSYLEAGIRRLFSMQCAGGGLGYWPGATTSYPYGSVYACHYLTMAKRDGGLLVPEENLKALQDYVRAIANDWDDGSSRFEGYRPISNLYLRAYAHYVLALDGDAEAIRQIERFDNLEVPMAARYLLAAALAMNTQDKDRVAMYLNSAPSVQDSEFEQDYTLNSDIRNTAVQLLATLQMGGSDQQAFELAGKLITYLETHRYGSTQETAFITTALAEYVNRFKAEPQDISASITGPAGEVTLSGPEFKHVEYRGPNGAFTVNNTGKSPIYVSFTTGGTPPQAEMKEIADGMKITRVTKSVSGKEVTDNVYAQGASYIVALTLNCDQEVRNVVIDDTLPAGFEIENPRLDPAAYTGLKLPEVTAPTYLEVRDDRFVVVFNHLKQGTHHFYYVVRAVTPGTFQRPGVRAECMYDAKIRSTMLPGWAQVK